MASFIRTTKILRCYIDDDILCLNLCFFLITDSNKKKWLVKSKKILLLTGKPDNRSFGMKATEESSKSQIDPSEFSCG